MTNIILCGGVGSRLWPVSRAKLPKQFARLTGGDTLFEATVKRNRVLFPKLLVASNADQAHLAARQLAGLGVAAWDSVVEPAGRNTAPAIALACLALPADELVLVSPSDHVIADQSAYERALRQALDLAAAGDIVTFGIKPDYPETGFGYIESDANQPNKVASFKEKPDLATAKSYLHAGNYFWNSGMFCFRAGDFLRELATHAPEVAAASRRAFDRAERQSENGLVLCPGAADMQAIPAISVDYAVMERSKRVAMVSCDVGWSDLGCFDALFAHLTRVGATDGGGNAFTAEAEPLLLGCNDNLVIAGGRTVALVDVDDLIVVDSPDALLVTRRNSSQRVKDVVEALKSGRPDLL